MTGPKMVSHEELEILGQVTYNTTPGNVVTPCYCGRCGGHYTSTFDFEEHKKAGCIKKIGFSKKKEDKKTE